MNNSLITHQALETNVTGTDWVCSDIHGHLETLQSMLSKSAFNPETDRLLFVGDLIDRGPDSLATLNFVLETPWCHSVVGNHELMFWASYWDPALLNKRRYLGGGWADELSREEHHRLARNIQSQFSLAISLITPNGVIGIVHAQCPYDSWASWKTAVFSEVLAKQCTWDWSQSRHGRFKIEGVSAVVSGHTGAGSHVRGNQIWIDTLEKTGRPTLLRTTDLLSMVEQA